jgi:hypothetical protein
MHKNLNRTAFNPTGTRKILTGKQKIEQEQKLAYRKHKNGNRVLSSSPFEKGD